MPTDNGSKTFYDTLGVGIDATDEELRRAFRRKAARVHPDKVNAENRERATLEFQQLTNAYEVLSDAEVSCSGHIRHLALPRKAAHDCCLAISIGSTDGQRKLFVT